jgi:hypothetical protein
MEKYEDIKTAVMNHLIAMDAIGHKIPEKAIPALEAWQAMEDLLKKLEAIDSMKINKEGAK